MFAEDHLRRLLAIAGELGNTEVGTRLKAEIEALQDACCGVYEWIDVEMEGVELNDRFPWANRKHIEYAAALPREELKEILAEIAGEYRSIEMSDGDLAGLCDTFCQNVMQHALKTLDVHKAEDAKTLLGLGLVLHSKKEWTFWTSSSSCVVATPASLVAGPPARPDARGWLTEAETKWRLLSSGELLSAEEVDELASDQPSDLEALPVGQVYKKAKEDVLWLGAREASRRDR